MAEHLPSSPQALDLTLDLKKRVETLKLPLFHSNPSGIESMVIYILCMCSVTELFLLLISISFNF